MVTDSLFILEPSLRSGLTKRPLNRKCSNSMSFLNPRAVDAAGLPAQIAIPNNILALHLLTSVLVDPYPPGWG